MFNHYFANKFNKTMYNLDINVGHVMQISINYIHKWVPTNTSLKSFNCIGLKKSMAKIMKIVALSWQNKTNNCFVMTLC